MLRSALRRIAILLAVIIGLTTALALMIGALSHTSLLRALAVGFYVAGAAMLVGSFIFGLRGPLRSEWADDGGAETGQLPARRSGGLIPSVVRRTTSEERMDARHTSIGLFGFGIVLILIGAGFDPSRHAF